MVSTAPFARVDKIVDMFIGWFNAYGVAAHNTSADVFVHLGDYVRTLCDFPHRQMLT